MQSGMEITRRDKGGYPELLVAGRMDGYWSRHLEDAIDELMREGIHRTNINLSSTAYISSAGIRVLVHAYKQFSAVGGALLVVDPSPAVRKILDMAGLGEMLCTPTAEPTAAATREAPTCYEQDGCAFEVYDLCPGAQLLCRVSGHPERLAAAAFNREDAETVSLPADVIALGLGAFGESYDSCSGRFGEFLAVAGCAAGQPTEATGSADYMVSSGTLVPRLTTLYSICCRGEFSRLLRFESNPAAGPIAFGKIIAACVAAAGVPVIGVAMIAESAGILGASLKRSPADNAGQSPFHFPEIRQWLSFSPVRSYGRSVTVITGVAVKPPAPPELAPLLRPTDSGTSLLGHFHAAAFGYHPLRKGRVELRTLVHRLFDTGGLQGVIHMLTDDRQGVATVDSEFTRGACWIGPVGRFVSPAEGL